MARRKAATPPPVSELRGVVSFDTNEILALVLAPVEQVAEAFRKRRKAKTWAKNVGGKTVTVADPSFVVYRLKGHPWTILDCYHGRGTSLQPADAQALSKALKTKAIFYGNSDTAGVTLCDLFDKGKRLEHFEYDEGVEFESAIRDIEPPDGPDDIYAFVDAFLREQDALAPGISTYLGGWAAKPGDKVTLDLLAADWVERVDWVA